MKKLFLTKLGVLLFLAVPSLYAYNNQWSDNEDYVVVSEGNVEAGEGSENKEVKGPIKEPSKGLVKGSMATPEEQPISCPWKTPSPVYIKSGHFTWSDTDIVLPGRSGINFSRSYTSHEPLSGMFGNGWISNLESGFIETIKHLDNEGSTQIHYIYRNQNGLRYTFKEVGDTIEAPSGMYYTFKRLSETSYQVTDENKVTDTYSNDLLVSKEDANGNKREYVYDANAVLQSINDSNGNTLTLTLGGNGYVTAITDQNARTWWYDYDEEGNLVSVTDPLEGQRNYAYEAYQADNDAQSYFHMTEITDASDVVITAVEYESGYTGTNEWINGRVKSYTMGEDTYTYTWDYHLTSYGYVIKTDSLGNWTRLYPSESGHVTQYTDVSYKTTLYNVDENMTLTAVTDKNGNDWNQSVDESGRIVSKTTPLGYKTTLTYEGERRVPSEITSALGHVTKIAYDEKENPTTVTLPDNSTYKATYDTKGNVLDTTNPSGIKTSTVTYNDNSQATSIQNALGDTLSLSYNALSQMTTATDAEGNVVTYTHDILGNITKTVNAMGHDVVYIYDKSGRLLSLKDPAGNTTTYQYDTYGRVSKVIRPNGRTLTYGYDTANQVTTVTDSAGRETVLTYDRLGRVTNVSRGDYTYISYLYDAMGRLTRAYDRNSGQYVYFTYNEDGQIIQEKQHGKAVDYTYDADGKLATMTANGITTTYTRNSLGALTSLSDGTDTFSFTYDANGERKSITYPNGLQTTYGLDSASRLSTLDNGLEQNSYTYDKNGMMTQKTVDGSATDYSYDAAGRLTDAGADSYSYDTSGNILNNAAVYAATTNQLSATATHTYAYDAFGNLIKKTEKASGDYKVYTWNVWDQLIKAESFDSADVSLKTIEYAYGGLGRRLSKTVDGTVEKYVYSGSNMIATLNYYSYLTKRFVQDEAIDAPLSIYFGETDMRYYYHKDHLGSIVGISDNSGSVIESYSYDAYGKTTRAISDNTSSYFAFTGREMDDEDLYYYRSRYYDPTVGRFLSEDTIGFTSGDFNFYRYVGSSPINYVDPYGYGFWKTIGLMAAGAATGAVYSVALIGTVAATPVLIGAGAAGLVYGVYTAGEYAKTIIKEKKEHAKIEDVIERHEADKKTNSWGLKKVGELTEEMATTGGTGFGGPVGTSGLDAGVTAANAAAGDTIYNSDYRKKRNHNDNDPCK